MKVAVFFANGSEEIESLTPVDVLRRGGCETDLISVSGDNPVGSHGIGVLCDKKIEDVCLLEYDALIIPGGLPGANNMANNETLVMATKKALEQKKLVASICASPSVVLADSVKISGRKLTCFPSQKFIESVNKNNVYVNKNVVVDGNLITGNGPKSALEFSIAICEYLGIEIKI